MENLEETILGTMLRDVEYLTKVLPYVQSEYFHDSTERQVFQLIKKLVEDTGKSPDRKTLLLEASQYEWADSSTASAFIKGLYTTELPDNRLWLVKKTEEWCINQAVHKAISVAIDIYDGTNKELQPNHIVDLVKEAVSINFDAIIGHDFMDDASSRFDFYSTPMSKIPFDIDVLNEITNGGIPRKTLNVLIAGINVGKTLGLIHLASSYLKQGYNVLYITMEMSEEAIGQRIDANMLDIKINDVPELKKDEFMGRIDSIKAKTNGKLKIKEYPPGGGNSAHFRHLIRELKTRKGFHPDVIMVDYIGITGSSRIKIGATNSYFYIKAVAEELRAIAVEENLVCWTASQYNRGGMADTDADMTDVAESVGLPATSDFILSLVRTEELDELGQLMVKQLKTRYNNKSNKLRFTIGIDLEKQQWKNISDTSNYHGKPQHEDTSAVDNSFKTSSTANKLNRGNSLKSKFGAIDMDAPF